MNYFYKKGIDITNDKQMFNFLKDHFTYYTMNSWNGLNSIANNVKVYNLKLDGDCYAVLDFLNNEEYFSINCMIEDWELDHPGYSVGFNGRSGGYLVLYNSDNNRSVLPDDVYSSDDYEEYKAYCKDYYGSVKANRRDLVEAVKIVQSFDKLCDDLRDYCNELSVKDFTKEAMQEAVEQFNDYYQNDLAHLDMDELVCKEDGSVYVGQICEFKSLYEAFRRIADRSNLGYTFYLDNGYAKLTEK